MSEKLQTDSQISHYRIISILGAGGMGEVYLAQDTSELGRTVALKILPNEVAENKDRLQRFTQEARTVSNLNHPNILTVYEFGQTETVSFIASEYIDGVTLRQHLSGRKLKLIDILDVAIQMVGALNAAHEAGVMHRDLKPENVMVRKDHIVKVLDFGLAKLIGDGEMGRWGHAERGRGGDEGETLLADSPTRLVPPAPFTPAPITTPGVIMGTVNYMSPEQSAGKPVDHRTDIWSTGVLLYEMIAGHIPFQGKDVHRQIIAIQETDPTPLSQEVEGIPGRLEEIVEKCLAKDTNERYQTAKDLLIDLRSLRRKLDVDAEIDRTVAPVFRSTSLAAGASTQNAQATQPRTVSSAEYVTTRIKNHKLLVAVVAVLIFAAGIGATAYLKTRDTNTAIQSIAVMPFVNESGNSDLEYLSDGMTETLMSSLSQIPNLNVKARSLVFRYKGKETNPQAIGKDLDVQAVLNGRVVQRGTDLTVFLELVDARTGNLIWSDQYNRKQSDLVSLQSDLARDVSSKLRTKLTGAEEQKVTRNYTENSEAYKLYLQGRFLANKRTPRDSQLAIESFQKAASLDPNYALAYAGMGLGYSYLAIYGYSPAREVFPKSREYATKAIQLDAGLAEPHVTLGIISFLYDRDIGGWERENKRALELNRNSTDAHRLEGLRLLFLGKFEESIAEVKRALDIEPLSLAGNINYSYCLFYAGRLAESEAQTKKTVELSPEFWMSHYYLFSIYRQQRRYQEAAEELAKAKEFRGETESAKLIREISAKDGWQGLLKEACARPQQFKLYHYDLATFYAELGDKDNAFAKLNESVDDHEQFSGFIKVDPFLASLRDDPRYQQIIRRIGLPQ